MTTIANAFGNIDNPDYLDITHESASCLCDSYQRVTNYGKCWKHRYDSVILSIDNNLNGGYVMYQVEKKGICFCFA